MTATDYAFLQLSRDTVALQIRRAMSHNRAALPSLYAEARRLAMESLRAEVGLC